MTPERWRQVEDIYQSAMDREPEARPAWLAETCGEDLELKREVESLLKLTSTPVMVDQPAWQAAGELLDNDLSMAAGAQLGPYRIEGVLGAGGMGQVYRARDTRLDRTVAIKVSREEFGERFEREARAVAALNHPNICTLHDVGPNYLVMELVEGPTLAERIKDGPIPVAEALAIARQIGDALDAAHEAGIVHRDLKPGNIKIKPDGTVKVLDFGLAKRRPAGGASADPRESPTISMAATRDGMILGTAAYMSPEQARGHDVDKRSDIWAFGVVLYEMLTGSQLFMGATVTDTLAAVLTKEPDFSAIPARPRPLVQRCLEKDPKHRLRDIGDAWPLLDERPQQAGVPRSKVSWAVAAAAIAIAAIAAGAWWRATRPSEKPLVRLDVDLGADVTIDAASAGTAVIISPDGSRIAYLSKNQLFTRRLDESKAVEISRIDGAHGLFFSPDGQWIGFFAGSALKKVAAEGGAPIVLCPNVGAAGASWGQDGNIVTTVGNAGPLVRVPSNGGTPTPLTELDRSRGETTHRWPQVLPGAKAVLFTSHTGRVGFDEATIDVMSFSDRRRKTIHRGGTFGRYVPSGHLIYVSKGTLFAVRFDLDRLEVLGTPTPMLSPVAYSTVGGQVQLECSQTGTLVYRSSGPEGGRSTVQWVDSAGKTRPFVQTPGTYMQPALSPDGLRVAVVLTSGRDQDLWLYDSQRETGLRLTFDGSGKSHPVWTPDGAYIVYGGSNGMFWVHSDGSSKAPQTFTNSKVLQTPFSITPDGKRLSFQQSADEPHVSQQFDIWTVAVEHDASGPRAGKPEPFLQTPANERAPVLSPDGRWIAYESNESGRSQVYVRPFPESGAKNQISIDTGQIPQWARNGRELFFRNEDGTQILVAAYTVKGRTFVAEKPRVWSDKAFANPRSGRNYDLAPDGKRMVAIISDEPQSRHHVTFVENFFDELRRKVPAR